MMSITRCLKITKMGQKHSTTSIFVPILDRFVHSSWHSLNDLKYGKYDVQVIRDVEGSEDIVETVNPHLTPHLPINIIGSFRTERWKGISHQDSDADAVAQEPKTAKHWQKDS